MPSPLRSIRVRAPGFYGLNTQEAAGALDQGWADELKNAVFDEAGRVAARKGYDVLTSSAITQADRVFLWRVDRTTEYLISTGIESAANKIFYHSGTDNETRNDITGTGSTDTDWHFANANGYVIGTSQGQTPIYWDGDTASADFADITLDVGATVTPQGSVCLAAFGRLFVTDADAKVVYGSQLQPNPSDSSLNFDNWFIDTTGNSGGTAKDGWTIGRDFITGLAAFQDRLVIFGRESIQVYADVNGTVVLTDAVTGVGCVNQETIVHTEDDIIFLSATGLRSLRRTLVYETSPMGNLSRHVRDEFVDEIDASKAGAVYDPVEGMIVVFDQQTSYYFDTKTPLEDGSYRVSKWTMPIRAAHFDPTSDRTFLAIGGDVCDYSTYTDDTATYTFEYRSSWQNFGTERLKILKDISAIFSDGKGYSPQFVWAVDFSSTDSDLVSVNALPSPVGAEWSGTSSPVTAHEWGTAEWGPNVGLANQRDANASLDGYFVQFGVKCVINGNGFGIQQIQIRAKLGKI